ncbi:uncharacterized protein LOC123865283 [Maniola jurtina]|uniref:uncharacterized protein LOC123865283 n=1 Tax=Maniola jurtina TaxID=191418 RepID=UPI001E68CE96|nr:uncharacterized protein LOC123865283 [Maniola jurtina]
MISNTEMYLQTNFVDKSFQAALLPVNLLQYTSFLSKYTIRNNFIYPKGYIYCILSFFFVCSVIYAHYAHSRIDGMGLTVKTTISFSLIFNFVFHCFDCVLLFFSNIYSSKYAIKLVVRVQKITNNFRSISKNYFKNWEKENWIYVAGIYFLYFLVAFMFMFLFPDEVSLSVSRFAYAFVLLYYDVNIICAFRYVKLCEDCLGWWISNVRFYLKQLKTYENVIDKMQNKYYLKRLLDSYLDVLDSFDMVKTIFQLPVRTSFHLIFY